MCPEGDRIGIADRERKFVFGNDPLVRQGAKRTSVVSQRVSGVGGTKVCRFEGPRAFARSSATKRDTSSRFLLFDAFYCCILLGLDQAKLGDANRLEPAYFIVGYPEPYKGQAELIAGLLVDAEIRRLGIRPDDRDDIERQMVHLLDLSSPSRLSAGGDELLNRYAVSGFDRLRAAMAECDSLEDFLVGYTPTP